MLKNAVAVPAGYFVGIHPVYFIQPILDSGKSIQNANQHNTANQRNILVPCSHAHTQCCRNPNGGSCGYPIYTSTTHKNYPGAYKANTGYNVTGNTIGRGMFAYFHREHG